MKRFYKNVSAAGAADGSYIVLLDDKALKTPKRALLSLPTLPLAEAIAEEWGAQGDALKTESMPLTRLAFAALDVVKPERAAIAAQVLEYARHDLLCHRADEPPDLVARQAHAWDPLLDWAAETCGARLKVGVGIRHVPQPRAAIAELERVLARYDGFELAPLHTATTITGSLILALALVEKRVSAQQAFAAATLDETFQAEKWGRDAEAEKQRDHLFAELKGAEQFFRLLEC